MHTLTPAEAHALFLAFAYQRQYAEAHIRGPFTEALRCRAKVDEFLERAGLPSVDKLDELAGVSLHPRKPQAFPVSAVEVSPVVFLS